MHSNVLGYKTISKYLLAKGGGLLSTDEDNMIGLPSSDKPSDDDGCKIPDDVEHVARVVLVPRVFFKLVLGP